MKGLLLHPIHAQGEIVLLTSCKLHCRLGQDSIRSLQGLWNSRLPASCETIDFKSGLFSYAFDSASSKVISYFSKDIFSSRVYSGASGMPMALFRLTMADLKGIFFLIRFSFALLTSTSAFVTSNFGFVPTVKKPFACSRCCWVCLTVSSATSYILPALPRNMPV